MASSSSSHLPHAVIAGRNPASGASWQKGENTMGSSVVAHVSGEEQRGGLVDLAHVNSVRDIFALNAADIGDARSEAEAVEEEEEERELISDAFRSTALVSSREQVNGKPFCFSFPSAFVVSNPFLIFLVFLFPFCVAKIGARICRWPDRRRQCREMLVGRENICCCLGFTECSHQFRLLGWRHGFS